MEVGLLGITGQIINVSEPIIDPKQQAMKCKGRWMVHVFQTHNQYTGQIINVSEPIIDVHKPSTKSY